MFEFLKTLSFNRGTNIGFIIFGVFLAPYWFIFQFANDIYKSSNLTQTIILSLCIGVPVCLLNFIINSVGGLYNEKEVTEEQKVNQYFKLMGYSSIFGGISFYAPCIFKFFSLPQTQRQAIFFIIGIHIGYITTTIIYASLSNRKAKKAEKNLSNSNVKTK